MGVSESLHWGEQPVNQKVSDYCVSGKWNCILRSYVLTYFFFFLQVVDLCCTQGSLALWQTHDGWARWRIIAMGKKKKTKKHEVKISSDRFQPLTSFTSLPCSDKVSSLSNIIPSDLICSWVQWPQSLVREKKEPS